jgi:hypothetical protein
VSARLATKKATKNIVVGRCRNLGGCGRHLNTKLCCTCLALRVLTDTLNHRAALVQLLRNTVVLLLLGSSEITVLGRSVVEEGLCLLPRTTPNLLLALNESVHVDSNHV